MHNYPSIPLDSESTQMFSHLLAASGSCDWWRVCLCSREDSLGTRAVPGDLQKVNPSLGPSGTNRRPYITPVPTTYFTSCTNEFITREGPDFRWLKP